MHEVINPDQLYRLPKVKEFIPLSNTTIYRAMDEGWFPKPVRIGPRAVAWRGADLIDYLKAREHNAA